jgi:hypothetical protein
MRTIKLVVFLSFPNNLIIDSLRACLGISGMKGNEGYWGGGISITSQNFPKSPSILFHPLESSISQTSPKCKLTLENLIAI